MSMKNDSVSFSFVIFRKRRIFRNFLLFFNVSGFSKIQLWTKILIQLVKIVSKQDKKITESDVGAVVDHCANNLQDMGLNPTRIFFSLKMSHLLRLHWLDSRFLR